MFGSSLEEASHILRKPRLASAAAAEMPPAFVLHCFVALAKAVPSSPLDRRKFCIRYPALRGGMTMGAGAVMEPENPGSIAAADPSDRRLARLRQVIESRSLMRGDFTLTSGRKSNYLFQLRQTTLHGEGSSLLARLIVDFMKRLKLTCIG